MTQFSDTRSPASPDAPDRVTYEEFLRRWDGRHAEWVDGEVIEVSPSSDVHQDLAAFLFALLRHWVEARSAGVVRPAPFQMKLGSGLPGREPDVLCVAAEHLDRLKRSHLEGPADLVVEVVSPDSETRDRVEKLREYEVGGVPEYWLIDPERAQALFYRLGPDGRYRLMEAEGGIFRSAVLPGLWLRIEWLWQKPLPPLLSVLRAWGIV